jgi:hypothetical protein
MRCQIVTAVATAMLASGWNAMSQEPRPRTFGGDVEFLKKHTPVIVLGEKGEARVAVVPAWQGRVMTSTARGPDAPGYGWINDELIGSGKTGPHINVWGGEDRFWMGPEGGQYAIFFKRDDAFDLEHWQTPACIDTEAYTVASQDDRQVTCSHKASLTNYSGTKLDVQIDRTVRLLSAEEAARELGVKPGPAVKTVAYQSENRITNAGKESWTKATGLISVWILGMFKPSPTSVVVIPFHEGGEAERGPIVNDTYFGKVPADRLKIDKGVLYFKGDGQYRSKIGLAPRRAKPVCGSYDSARGVLTIVQYTQPAGATDYVNSMWELQKEPYGGDVVNSYNDGPPAPGKKPLGPFYELETSSPAAALKPGESLTHVHRTFHFEGPPAELNAIAKPVLGVGLEQIASFGTKD